MMEMDIMIGIGRESTQDGLITQGHILSDENASAYIDGWFSGQYAHSAGFGRNAPDSIFAQYDQGFYDGYDAPYPTLPAVASEHN